MPMLSLPVTSIGVKFNHSQKPRKLSITLSAQRIT